MSLKIPARRHVTTLTLGLALALSAHAATAALVISESFDRTDGTSANGLSPNGANLPGNTFTVQTNRTSVISSNTLQIGPDNSVSIDLGTYFSGPLSLSADLSIGNLITNTATNRGIALGFNTSPSGSHNTFVGLRLTPDSKLVFQQGAGPGSASVLATVDVSTTGSTFYSLSYDVNATTGALSNIALSGTGNDALDFSSIYTASGNQNYFSGYSSLSVFAGGSAAGQTGYVDNLTLSDSSPEAGVPEPATLALVTGGLLGAVSVRRRCRRR